jgi:hypothetical protein
VSDTDESKTQTSAEPVPEVATTASEPKPASTTKGPGASMKKTAARSPRAAPASERRAATGTSQPADAPASDPYQTTRRVWPD